MPCTVCVPGNITTDDPVACGSCAPAVGWCDGCDGEIRGGAHCEDCVECHRCEATVPAADTVVTATGSRVCQECCEDWYWRCGECVEYSLDGSRCANGCGDTQGCDCADCAGDDDRGDLVHDYEYKPHPRFHGAGPLFLGVEIEIETSYRSDWECAQLACTELGDLGYLKNDGSINHGFELVTHPMSYQWAIEHFPWQLLTDLGRDGCSTPSGTGIHVHISRAGFNDACHTYRWMKFIYRNQPQVTTLARRSSNYAVFTADDRRAVKDNVKGTAGHRYRAINTANEATFELRIFASSLDPDVVQAALGFAAASVEYTRTLTYHQIAHGGGWSWQAFVTWLHQRPIYAPLTRQLEALACAC